MNASVGWKGYYLAGNSVGAELSKSQRWWDFPEKRDDVNVLDPALGIRVVFAPQPDELIKVMRSQDGPIPCEVIEVVHDDSDEQVEDEEGADHEERDEVNISEIRATTTLVSGIFWPLVTDDTWILLAAQHDLLPGLSSGWPEQHQQGLGEGLEVVVPVDVGALLRSNLAKDLHSNHTINEEDQGNQDGYPRKSLEGLDERPEECPDTLSLA